MKRNFSKILFLIGTLCVFITNLNAFELTYSEWSEEYPSNIDEILIDREDRFYHYKDVEVNIEYLIKEDILDKLYDENDIKYFESEELLEKPESKLEREIIEIPKTLTYNSSDVRGVSIESNDQIQISELVIKDKDNNLIECNGEFEFLTDNDLDTYYDINSEVYCFFNNNYEASDLYVSVYSKNDGNKYTQYLYKLINDSKVTLYSNYLAYIGKYNITFSINNIKNQLVKNITYYKYIDKLYKTYDIEKEYINEYYSNLEGYVKDESTLKKFYRYITNDYIIVDEYDKLVIDDNYCKKEFCRLIYLIEQETDIIENPHTYDSIYNYIFLLLISLIILIIFVKKCHMNKKSSFVESI